MTSSKSFSPSTSEEKCKDNYEHDWIYYGDITHEIVYCRCQVCGLLQKSKASVRWIPQ